jgi:hypothetical protein
MERQQPGKDAPSRSSDVFPRPDPTVLTTQQLLRELASMREIIEARLDGMDKAIVLIQNAVERTPTIAEIYAEFREKSNSVQTQFRERDARVEQTSKDSKVAVDAALQAAKEAVGEQNKSSSLAIAKSEAATMKQIDQLGILIQNMEKGLNDKVGDMKDRLTLIEGRSTGKGESWGVILGSIGAMAGVLSILGMIIVLLKR